MSGEEGRGHKVDVCDEGRSGGEGRSNVSQVKAQTSKTLNPQACMCRWRGVTVSCHVRPLAFIYFKPSFASFGFITIVSTNPTFGPS